MYRFRWRRPPDDDWVLFVVEDHHRVHRHARDWPSLLDESLQPLDRAVEPVTAAGEQLDRWAEAGEAFIAAVRRASLRYRPRRRRWFPRRAEERRLRAIRDALAAYQPVRDEIQPIWDRSRAARAAAEEREKAERAEQWARAEAAYEAWWGTRAAAAELAGRKAWRLTGTGEITYGRGRSAYELALTLTERPRWTPQALAALPDDPEQWWARVQSAARNRQALDDAAGRCAATVHRVLRALVAAGRPGIEEFTTSTGHREDGWRPAFDWSARRVPPPAIEEPPPPPKFPHGSWSFPGNYYGKFAEVALLVPGDPESRIAWSVDSPSDYHRPNYWTYNSVESYLGITFDDSVTYHQSGWSESSISFRMADEADPAAFIPFVEATADVIAAGFEQLLDADG